MNNNIIEQFIKTNITENEIVGLIEEDSLVKEIPVSEIEENVVNEIKKYGERGYRNDSSLVIYFVPRKNEIWIEGGY